MHLVIPHLLIRVLLWSRSMGCCYFRSWRRIKGWEHIGKALHWMYVFWIIVGECCSIYWIDSHRQCQFRLETSMAIPPRERNGEQPCPSSKQLDRYCLRRLLLHQGRCPVSNTFVVNSFENCKAGNTLVQEKLANCWPSELWNRTLFLGNISFEILTSNRTLRDALLLSI